MNVKERSEKYGRNLIPVKEHPLHSGHCPAELLESVKEAFVDCGRPEEDGRLHLRYSVVEGVGVVNQIAAKGIIWLILLCVAFIFGVFAVIL